MAKKNNDRAKTLSGVISKIREKGGTVQNISGKGEYVWKNTRLPPDADLTPENIQEQIKHNKVMEELIAAAEKWREEQDKIIKKEAEKQLTENVDIPKDVIYDKKGNLTDLSGNSIKKVRSIAGFLPALAAAALSMYAPDSKATTVAKTVSRVLDEGDPTSVFFPSETGEGEEDEVARMRKEQKDRYFNNLMKNMPENENVRSVEEMPIKKVLEGKLLSQAQDEEDETELANNSVEDMKYEDYIEKMKRKLGYV